VVQVETRVVESAGFQRLELKYDELLSSLAFSFNLRPCNKAQMKKALVAAAKLAGAAADIAAIETRW
jgi:hypothetical protein